MTRQHHENGRKRYSRTQYTPGTNFSYAPSHLKSKSKADLKHTSSQPHLVTFMNYTFGNVKRKTLKKCLNKIYKINNMLS